MLPTSLPRVRFATAGLACGLCLSPGRPVTAQWPAHGAVYERTVRQRWMNAHQSPAFTRWNSIKTVVHLDSLQPAGGGVVAFFALGDPRQNNRTRAQVQLRADGRLAAIATSFDVPPKRPPLPGGDPNLSERYRVASFDGLITLPGTVTSDLIPTLHPARYVAGASWIDTVAWNGEHAGISQSVRGVRRSTLLRDSTAEGHHYWLVRDTMLGTWSERVPEYDRTLKGDVTTFHETRGIIAGEYLVDVDSRLLVRRDDTLTFKGTATLRYPDGRSYSSPTVLQQTRHIEGFDSTAFAALLMARRAAAPRFSMFRFPEGSAEEALAAGNVAVRDSLLRAFHRSRDIDERLALQATLSQWRPKNYRQYRDTVLADILRDGDTTSVVAQLLDPASTQLTTERLALVLPFARDPGRAFAFGIPIGEFFENVEQRLTETVPALTRDTTAWRCTPAACAKLASLRTSEKEPRLRRLGLVAAFALDPRRWVKEVRADTSLTRLRDLTDGVGATWPASTHPRMPAAGASWQRWYEWMNGKSLDSDSTVRAPGTVPSLRYTDGHHLAVAMTELLTGRRLIDEWQEQLDGSSSSVERYVFEDLLAMNRAWHPDVDSIAAWLQSDAKMDRARGRLGASTLDLAPADSATTTELIDRVLTHAIDGELPWPSLNPSESVRPVGALLDNATRPGRGLAAQEAQTIYVKTPLVTPELRAKWGQRVTWITDMQWELTKDRYPAAVITIRQVERTGKFASIGEDIFSARQDSKGINAGAGGTGYLLLLTRDGWKIVETSMWVV